MALTARKKLGLSIIISGAIGIVVGIIVFATTSTPTWVVPVISAAVTVISALTGLVIQNPQIPE